MTLINIERDSAHTPQQMFTLVANIDDYCKFIPYCVGSRIVKRRPGVPEILHADLIVNYKLLHENYRSEVELHSQDHKIIVKQLRGPFRDMHTYWHFKQDGKQTKILFTMDFSFRLNMFKKLLEPILNKATMKMIEAFERRADEIYGAEQ